MMARFPFCVACHLWLLTCVAFLGCSKGTDSADLVIANGADPRSLDPAAVTALADGRILSALFEGLLDLHPKSLAVVPAMAEALPEVSGDGRTYTFRLRQGLVWSDGVPIDAEGLRWSFLRFLDPRTGARFTDPLLAVVGARAFNASGGSLRAEAVGIHADGPRILRFELEAPLPTFPSLLTLFPLYPVPRHVVEKHGDAWTRKEHFVSNGPFTLSEWRLRDRVRVVRNPRYRDTEAVHLRSIDYLCVESPATMLNLLVAGRADIIVDVPTSAVTAIATEFAPESGAAWLPELRLGTFYLAVNLNRPPLSNRKVRRALSAAIDRRAITQVLLRAGEQPATSFVPRGVACGTSMYEPPTEILAAPLEPSALLKEGLAELQMDLNEASIELIYSTTEATDQPIAELLQESWTSLGLRVRLVNLDSASARDAIRRGQFQIARASWIGDYNDPSTFLDLLVTGGARNPSGWSNPRYDELVTQLARTTRNDVERAGHYREAESILMEEAVIIPVFHYVSRSLVRRGVLGFYPNVLDWHPPKGIRILEDQR
jgi:oligopeptide transport system substrate-binding protein